MTIQATALQRSGAAFAALFVAFCLLSVVAPPAHAQVDVIDTVEDTTDDVTETVEDVVNVDEDPDKGPVEETVDTVTETVDEVTGGASKPVTDEVRKVTRENLGPVDDILGGATDGVLGGNVPDIGRGTTGGSIDETKVLSEVRRRNGQTAGQPGAGSIDEPVGGAVDNEVVPRPPVTETPVSGGLAEQAGQIAREIAFPLLLLIMVAAFLTIQGRWDKRDPKLALAPLDIDEQYLSFR